MSHAERKCRASNGSLCHVIFDAITKYLIQRGPEHQIGPEGQDECLYILSLPKWGLNLPYLTHKYWYRFATSMMTYSVTEPALDKGRRYRLTKAGMYCVQYQYDY